MNAQKTTLSHCEEKWKKKHPENETLAEKKLSISAVALSRILEYQVDVALSRILKYQVDRKSLLSNINALFHSLSVFI